MHSLTIKPDEPATRNGDELTLKDGSPLLFGNRSQSLAPLDQIYNCSQGLPEERNLDFFVTWGPNDGMHLTTFVTEILNPFLWRISGDCLLSSGFKIGM